MSDEPSEVAELKERLALLLSADDPTTKELRAELASLRADSLRHAVELMRKAQWSNSGEAFTAMMRQVADWLESQAPKADPEREASLRADSMRGAVEMLRDGDNVNDIVDAIDKRLDEPEVKRRIDYAQGDWFTVTHQEALAVVADWLESQAPKADPEREAKRLGAAAFAIRDEWEAQQKPGSDSGSDEGCIVTDWVEIARKALDAVEKANKVGP